MTHMMTVNLNELVVVDLVASIWTARAKLRAEDLPPAVAGDLPPETLATLGSKRLFDPDKLKVFSNLKMKATRTLSRYGRRFLSGYAVPLGKFQELEQELEAIGQEFSTEVLQFLGTYETGVVDWLAQYPDWAHILRQALPSVKEISKRFHFSWRAYAMNPVASTSKHNDTAAQISSLADSTYAALEEALTKFYQEHRVSTDPVGSVAQLQFLLDKYTAVGFVYPQVGAVVDDIKQALTGGYGDAMGAVLRFIPSSLTSVQPPQQVEPVTPAATSRVVEEVVPIPAVILNPISPAVLTPEAVTPVQQKEPNPVGFMFNSNGLW